MPNKHLLYSISTLVGLTIGAGILGIPFAVIKAGFLTGLLNIIILGILVLILNLYLGEVTLRTRGIHQLTGYAKIYLGKIGYYLMLVSFLIFSHGALIAYIIKTGDLLYALFALFTPLLTPGAYSIMLFVILFVIVYIKALR